MGGLRLSSVHLESGELSLDLVEINTKLELSCLWNSRFCFEQFSVESVAVVWNGGSWRSGETRAQFSITETRIVVDSIQSEDALLTLSEASRPGSDDGASSVELPLALVINNARLERAAWDIYGEQYVHDFISFRGQWLGHSLELPGIEIGDEALGNLKLAGQMTLSGDWPFKLTANAHWRSELTLADVVETFFSGEQVQADSLPSVSLSSPWSLSAEGSRLKQTFTVEAGISGLGYEALQLSLSTGHLPFVAARETQAQLLFERIALRDIKTDSELVGSGTLSLGEQNHWALSARTNGFKLPDLNNELAGRLAGSFQLEGNFSGNTWDVALRDINLQGSISDLPAHIKGRAHVNEALLLSDTKLQADLNGAHLEINSQSGVTQGPYLRLGVEDLGRWLPDSRGKLVLTADLSPEMRTAEFEGRLSEFQWQSLGFRQGNVAGQVDLAESRNFNFETIVTSLTFNSLDMETVSLSATGNQYRQTLQLVTTGDLEARLAGVSELSLGDGEGSGIIGLEGELTSLGGLLAEGYDLNGGLRLDLEADWKAGALANLTGEFQLLQPELRKALGEDNYAIEKWDRASVRVSKGGGSLQFIANGTKDKRDVLALNMTLPDEKAGALSGELALHHLDISDLEAFIPVLSRLEGTVNGQVKLSDTGQNLLAHGNLALTQGSFSVLDNPTVFEDLQLQLQVQGDKAAIQGGMLLGGGQLDITGNLTFEPEAMLELHLVGQKETLLFPPSTQLQVSHTIKLLATADYLDVSGKLVVHEGVLEHEELAEGGIALSEDVIIVGDIAPQLRPFDLAMDVHVIIEDNFKVVGNVVDVTVGGDLHMLQERGRPMQLFGNLNVVGGELRAYGQHLQVGRGTVAFSGAPENPTLDMRAKRIIPNENITVGLELQGTLEDPRLEVYSDPVMPVTESLSYLVRGRGLDAGAGADGTALALSMGASIVNQTGVLGQLDKIPGINSVTLGADGQDDDTTATVSGYIGNRIYLSYGVGLYEPINVLTARLYLQARLWLEVVSSLENSLDLYYSFDIE